MNNTVKILKSRNFTGHEMLMNPMTGSVDTAENWACEIEDNSSDFETLIEVAKDEGESWVEV